MAHASENTATPRNVARAVVIKAGDIFLLSEQNGEIPAGNQDGFGLYHHDCRYLDGYNIQFAGTAPNVLVTNAHRGSIAEFELTNEKLQVEGSKAVAPQTFGITLHRIIDSDHLAVLDVFTIANYDIEPHELPITLSFHSEFEDIFEIRGLHPKKAGQQNNPEWHDGDLLLSYSGADGVERRLDVNFDPKPQNSSGSSAHHLLQLAPGERKQIKVSLCVNESREKQHTSAVPKSSAEQATSGIEQRSTDWLANYAEVSSNYPALDRVLKRSLLDLGTLKSSLDDLRFFSAGLPWYGTLFGRDSITAALQTLAYEPQMAEHTIRLLAKYQGTKDDNWRDEEPGKILHELRRGELANLNEIPQTPYYGSVDSTPLFLILVGEHANWTGDLGLFKEIQPHVERALHWIDNGGAEPKGKYLSYASKSSKGLGNQGWKDSGVSIMNADGSLATPPISLVEVQGYVYSAKLLIADLYERNGDQPTAARLRGEAATLKANFNRDFWLDDKQFYAIALQKDGRPADVISSNPGQALWTGIIDESRAEKVVQHLMAEDMFSGWGIRTLSHKERRYNPIGYHLGTVWPHDNSIIAAGFRRYGFDKQAASVLDSIIAASRSFEHARLPEVFGGFSQKEFSVPVRYPVACHPQAWAAGSVPSMLASLLGLTADAFNGRLRIVRPVLPNSVNELEFRRIKIGKSSVDLRFERTSTGEVKVKMRKQGGKVDVEIEQDQEDRQAA
jgi:glycogen debranching enzyme